MRRRCDSPDHPFVMFPFQFASSESEDLPMTVEKREREMSEGRRVLEFDELTDSSCCSQLR